MRASFTFALVLLASASRADQWTPFPGVNCYPNHGGTPMDSSDDPVTGVKSLAECQQKCEEKKGCMSVVMRVDGLQSDYCWLRSAVVLTACEASVNKFNTFALFNGSQVYDAHSGVNCFKGHGGQAMDPNDTPLLNTTMAICKIACDVSTACSAFVMPSGGSAGKCYLRSSTTLSQCETASTYDTYIMNAGKRRGSFFVLGDWGYDSKTHGDVKPGCQKAIADAMEAKRKEMGDVLFVVNVGDSFYPNGVASKDDPQWDTKWKNIYGADMCALPWFSVYGNHDYQGMDTCACNLDESHCAQVNSSQAGWFMPAMSYWDDRYMDELQMEIVALDINAIDNYDGLCRYSKCTDACPGVLQKRKDAALALLTDRMAHSKAKNMLVFSHYPTDYLSGAGGEYNTMLNQLSDPSRNIVYYGGHRHNTDQGGMLASTAPNVNWLVGGGGGWSCDGWSSGSNQQGFVVGEIGKDYSVKTYSVIVDESACC